MDEIRRRWLERLGRPVELDFALFVVDDVFPRGEGRAVALGEVGTGRIAAGDELEAVGVAPEPTLVRVALVEQPSPDSAGVVAVEAADAGQSYALTLEIAAGATLAPGQCLAPRGRLAQATAIDAEVWILPVDLLPGSPFEQRRLLADAAAGRGLDAVFHTRPVAARPTVDWRPALGAEYRLAIELAHPVALYPATRFALRYEGLVFGAGVVISGR